MKGIILAGGHGTRLRPLTTVTSKQLLPVYDKPMIMYPLETLLRGGVKDILIIVAPDHAGDFLQLLGSGKEFDAHFTYEIQDKPAGLADAFILGADFIGDDTVAMMLGDNIFEDDFSEAIRSFKNGCHIFAKKVSDPDRFGVVAFNEQMMATQIVEKPKTHISDYAITGLYLFDPRVVAVAKGLQPSVRGELEITDLHNWYLARQELRVDIVIGEWIDAGTVEALHRASIFIANKRESLLSNYSHLTRRQMK